MSVFRKISRGSARTLRLLTRLTVTLVGIALTVGMGAIALLPNMGARAMIVTSGSMEPTIDVGALVIVEELDPDTIAVGDVITYSGYTSEGLTTHRVIERTVVAERLHFRTQGDANDTPDVDLAPAEGVVGKVRFDVPYAGRAMSELTRPELRYLALGGVSVWLLAKNALALRHALRNRGATAREHGGTSPAMSIAFAALLVSAAAGLTVDTTSAAFTDTTTISENSFATGTW